MACHGLVKFTQNKKPLRLHERAFICCECRSELLHFNFSTCFFKLLLQVVCSCFVNLLFNGLWSTVNKVLSFLQAKTGKILNDLNHVQLLSACALQDHVEFSLLSSSSRASAWTCSYSYSSSSWFDTVISFQN